MKGYLFDLDGTLIQSMHVWEDAVMRLFDRLNLKMDIEEAKDAFSAMKFTEVLETLITRFHLPMSVKELYGMVIDDVRRQYAHTVQPVNGAVELVKQCAAAGKRMCGHGQRRPADRSGPAPARHLAGYGIHLVLRGKRADKTNAADGAGSHAPAAAARA